MFVDNFVHLVILMSFLPVVHIDIKKGKKIIE